MDWLFNPAAFIEPVLGCIRCGGGVSADCLGVVAIDPHQHTPRRVGDLYVEGWREKTGVDQRCMAEDDGAGLREERDAIDAHRDESYFVVRWRSGDHHELEAAVEKRRMNMKLTRGSNKRLGKTNSSQSLAVPAPDGLDGAKHRAIEQAASCRSGVDLVGG